MYTNDKNIPKLYCGVCVEFYDYNKNGVKYGLKNFKTIYEDPQHCSFCKKETTRKNSGRRRERTNISTVLWKFKSNSYKLYNPVVNIN